ncbi:MAG: 3'-5' exonuclease, partial [Clostridia bacterium]|nr:3'-5' exonuclease [Clostridia bacterium]
KMIFLDLEMTGDARADEILSITLADGTGKVILDTLICPEKATRWPFTVRIHHITPKMVRHAPKIKALVPVIERILSNADEILGFSVQNDWKYLARLDEIHENEEILSSKVRCCQVFYDRFLRMERPDLDIGKRSLGNAMATLGLEWKGTPHSSRADTIACADVWKRIFLSPGETPSGLSEDLLKEKEEREARKLAEAQRRKEGLQAKMENNSENDTEDKSV